MVQSILRRPGPVAGRGRCNCYAKWGTNRGLSGDCGCDGITGGREHAEVICTENAFFGAVAATHLRQTARYKTRPLAIIPSPDLLAEVACGAFSGNVSFVSGGKKRGLLPPATVVTRATSRTGQMEIVWPRC